MAEQSLENIQDHKDHKHSKSKHVAVEHNPNRDGKDSGENALIDQSIKKIFGNDDRLLHAESLENQIDGRFLGLSGFEQSKRKAEGEHLEDDAEEVGLGIGLKVLVVACVHWRVHKTEICVRFYT